MSHHEYASTTDLILQNLTMIIGNQQKDVRLPGRIQHGTLRRDQGCCASIPGTQ